MGSKVAKFLKKNQNVTYRNGWVSLKGIFRWYIYVDVILVHIKTRLDLLGIQTFRWDPTLRLQLRNFFMALGRHLLEVVNTI